MKKQSKRFEKYLNFLNANIKRVKRFNKRKNPKISVISPIFNRERYIPRFIRSIQCQYFNDIEIIFVNDCSTDNSVNIIETYSKYDKRMQLIKLKKNKGTFAARNIGILFSKGKYIILPDPDDIISKNILNKCYKYCERNKYEIIRFIIYDGKNTDYFYNYNKQIHQPELSTFLFYGDKELKQIDIYIHNKFIKKDVCIRALNSINYFNLYIYTIYMEDQILNYILYRTAQSFFHLKIIGYYYIRNSISITKNINRIKTIKLRFMFIYLKLLFENSKNKKNEKDMCNNLLDRIYKAFNSNTIRFSTSHNNFYNQIIENYLNNKFITIENKNLLKKLK